MTSCNGDRYGKFRDKMFARNVSVEVVPIPQSQPNGASAASVGAWNRGSCDSAAQLHRSWAEKLEAFRRENEAKLLALVDERLSGMTEAQNSVTEKNAQGLGIVKNIAEAQNQRLDAQEQRIQAIQAAINTDIIDKLNELSAWADTVDAELQKNSEYATKADIDAAVNAMGESIMEAISKLLTPSIPQAVQPVSTPRTEPAVSARSSKKLARL